MVQGMEDLNFEACKFLPPDEERRQQKKKRSNTTIILVLVVAGVALLAGCLTLVNQQKGGLFN